MRRSSSFLGIIAVGTIAPMAFVACGANVAISDTGGGGEGTTTSTTSTITTSTSSTTTGSVSTTSSSSGSPSCAPPKPLAGGCAPSSACAAATKGSTCLSLVDQSGSSTPGLRMSALRFTKPSAFTSGIVSQVFGGAVLPNDVKCNLNGSATFSWLLRFDLATGALTTGGSKPPMSAAGPYAFVNQAVVLGGTTFNIQPVTLTAQLSSDCTFDSSAGDVLLPLFLDAVGTQMILLPLRSASVSAQISADHGCIGRFNAEGLDPGNSCFPTDVAPDFLPGGKVGAFISLEEADKVLISSLAQTLCVLLSQNVDTYGTKSSSGITVCKRDAANHIVFQGDWCVATNQAASGGCADAVRVDASFAAQGVQIQ